MADPFKLRTSGDRTKLRSTNNETLRAGVPSVGQPTQKRSQSVPTGSGYRDRIPKWN